MKKLLKNLLKVVTCAVLIFVCLTSFTACKTPISATTTSVEKVYSSYGKTTNGGMSVVYNGYLYFVNGTKTNDGTSQSGNKRGAIYRKKINEDGSFPDNAKAERVVSELVGYEDGSIYFFGNFMYYTTPNDAVNYKNAKLNNQTKFRRYDLVYGNSYDIYTTKLNSADETVDFEYYVSGSRLTLVVYEKTNGTITSINVGDSISTNYVISKVSTCILSENCGKSEVDGQVDANNFVYYTKANEYMDYYQTGVKVFMTSPIKNNSVCLSNEGKNISLLSIYAGKLIYSVPSINQTQTFIKYQTIDASTTSLSTDTFDDCILSHTTHENLIFVEIEGKLAILCYDTDSKVLILIRQNKDNPYEDDPITLDKDLVSNTSSFSLIGTVTLDVDETGDSQTPIINKVLYLIYTDANKVYKVEIGRYDDEENFTETKDCKPVLLAKSEVDEVSGNLVPEIIDNYLYIMAPYIKDDESKGDASYMHRVDLTITKDSEVNAEFFAVKE